MKKLFLLVSVAIMNLYSVQPFEFISYKDSNSFLDVSFFQKISDVFHPDIFFETGTYLGQTTENAVPFFRRVLTVELHDRLYQQARSKLAKFNNVMVYHGKSPEVIYQVAPNLQGTILFWLDAHYSGKGTAVSSDNAQDPKAFTAIREELRAIKELNIQNSIILIDDIRGFGTKIGNQEYLGAWAYPTVQEIIHDLLEINPRYAFALVGDILFAYDSDVYHPTFSDTVIACTKTRLYDGYNLSDEELLRLERIIMQAPAHEKAFIKKIGNLMIDDKRPFFWYDLLRGLVEFGSEDYWQARIAFTDVQKVLQDPLHSLRYGHWRIDKYLQECPLF